MKQHAKRSEKEIGEVRGEMRRRFDLDHKRDRTAPDRGHQFFAGLDRAFRPAMLLRLEAVHVDRQLGGRDHVREENKFPARQLRAVAEVEVFGQRVVLPAACFIDAGTPPETCGSVEIEKASAAAARGLLKEEMAVEEHCLDASEK